MKTSIKKKRTGWLIKALGMFAGLLFAGAIYQMAAAVNDQNNYPPPGELVEVAGHQMHLYCIGTGSPTVVLESGLGETMLNWSEVQKETAVFTRVCSYDRVGFGWSDPVDDPISSAQVATSLHTLLKNAGERSPYLLVGHSIGGVHVRSFAHQYPDEVAGIVLVDSSHEQQLAEVPDEAEAPALEFCRTIAPFGIIRLLGLLQADSELNPHLTAEQRQMSLTLLNQSHRCQAILNELTAVETDMRQPHLNSLGNLPLTVLTETGNINQYADGNPGQPLPQALTQWQAYQLELVALSTNSSQILAAESGHFIQYDQPELVIEAIQQMVAVAQAGE